ncbi:hypothetical protein [Nonomuraea cavernae]|nr:hypothetical protein [Nonomuraea cavernae]MCA2187209.1 hypothetical protein [Nonomuraea cavernae]
MAEVKGVGFSGSPDVDRSRLPETHIRPSKTDYGGISWPIANGSTSESPASARAFADMRDMDIPSLIRWVWEGLEIPGTVSDYHFLLQSAIARLWSARASDPSGLRFLEVFADLDLRLIEAAPRPFLIDEDDTSKGYFHFSGVATWVTLLQTEGALREALAINRRLQRFHEGYRLETLEAKIAALDEEARCTGLA